VSELASSDMLETTLRTILGIGLLLPPYFAFRRARTSFQLAKRIGLAEFLFVFCISFFSMSFFGPITVIGTLLALISSAVMAGLAFAVWFGLMKPKGGWNG
jgi:hypothetical protein